uniref:Uncharacterized protein n=1 Tax=Ananas comosus var. bracteatus TaxID=296719 RepID=A0A6V7PYG0_ANACO|nr:unnamed protein product [Ananas comosus var. bracteatus]
MAVANSFGCSSKDFPITYLGLPLSPMKLRRADYMPLIEKIDNRLAGWKGLMLSRGGPFSSSSFSFLFSLQPPPTAINPSTPEALLRSPPMALGVTFHRSPNHSLNASFLSRAVAVCDDDVALSPHAPSPSLSPSFAFALAPAPPCRLLQPHPRPRPRSPRVVYAARRDCYSILLAKFLLLLALLLLLAPLLRR